VRDAARSFGRIVMRRRGPIAVALLLAGVLFAGLYRVADGIEKHSYNSGAVPPQTVQLTRGHQYEISVPGGRTALEKRGIPATVGQCTLTPNGGGPVPVMVTPIAQDVRPTNALATFASPVSGRVHLDCGVWGAVYVDDSDDSGWDYSGLFIVLTAILLTLGVALGLSALYARSARDDEEIERRIGFLGGHDEVGPGDADDVLR
jgi:hypothetical protein